MAKNSQTYQQRQQTDFLQKDHPLHSLFGTTPPSNASEVFKVIQEGSPAFQELFIANLLKNVGSLASQSVPEALGQKNLANFPVQQSGPFQGLINFNDLSNGMLQSQTQTLGSNGPTGGPQLQDILVRMLGPQSSGLSWQGPGGLPVNNNLGPRGLSANNDNLGRRRLPVPEFTRMGSSRVHDKHRRNRKRPSSRSNFNANSKEGQPTPFLKSDTARGTAAQDQHTSSGSSEKVAKLESSAQQYSKTILSNSRRERVSDLHRRTPQGREWEEGRQRLAVGRNQTLVEVVGTGFSKQDEPKHKDSSSAFVSTSFKTPTPSSTHHFNRPSSSFDSHYQTSFQGMRTEPAPRWPTPSHDYFNQQQPPFSQSSPPSGVPPSYPQPPVQPVPDQYYETSATPASNSYVSHPPFYPPPQQQQQQQHQNPSSYFYHQTPDMSYSSSFTQPPQASTYPPLSDRSTEIYPPPYTAPASNDYCFDHHKSDTGCKTVEPARQDQERSQSYRHQETRSKRVTVYNVSKKATSDTLLKICGNFGRVLDLEFIKENGEDRAIIKFEPGD